MPTSGSKPWPKIPNSALASRPRHAPASSLLNILICFAILYNFAQFFTYLLIGTMSGTSNATDPSGNLAQQIILLCVFVLSIYVAARRGVSVPMTASAIWPALPLLVVMMASFFWSEYPSLTLRRSLREVLELASFALLALSITDSKKLLRLFFYTFLAILAADIVSLAFPAFSQTSIGFAGIHGEKNEAGGFFSLALPVFAIGLADRSVCKSRILAIAAVIACAALLLASQSKTALLTLVLAVGCAGFVLPATGRSPTNRLLLPLIYGFCALALAIVVFGTGIENIRNLLPDPTFTGRVQVWQYAYDRFAEKPFLGVGYGALWQVGSNLTIMLKNYQVTWVMNEAHNGYLDVLAQLGIVGLCALVFFLGVSIQRILRFAREFPFNGLFSFTGFVVYIAAVALFTNITESQYFRPGTANWFIVWFLYVLVSGRLAERNAKLAAIRR